ncbi:MAG: Kdo2-lipid lauroyltransferase/acyltransferase [Halanaerobiales bacterium]|nr:Kdo2-lipid lauroyltransferase/acyltransferase [Halanaerobiales bacterium]
MKHLILYLLFEAISILIRVLPDRVRYYLGLGLGKLVFHLVKSRREVAAENIKKALGDELTADRIYQLTKKVYHHLGLMLVEFILLPKINRDNFRRYIRVENEEILKQALERGKGVIIYGAHFGNWEWMGAVISLLGYPFNAIVRKQNNPYFDARINQIRRGKGVRIIPKGMSVRKAYRCLKRGEGLLVLGDQDARSHGWEVTFFGQKTSTFPGAVQLARRTGAVIVPTFLIREAWGRHRLVFHQPYIISRDASEREQRELLQKLTAEIEAVIRSHPEQWLWLHRRWKNHLY